MVSGHTQTNTQARLRIMEHTDGATAKRIAVAVEKRMSPKKVLWPDEDVYELCYGWRAMKVTDFASCEE